jgi:hypothetical protein
MTSFPFFIICADCFWLFVVDYNFPVHAAFQGATPFSTTLEKSKTLCYVWGGCNDFLHFVSLSSKSCFVIWLQHECFPPKGTAMMFLILKVVWESYMSLAKHGSVETLGTKHITHILLVLILLDVSAGLCSSSKFNNLIFLFHWLWFQII